jgi:hypothetical protein
MLPARSVPDALDPIAVERVVDAHQAGGDGAGGGQRHPVDGVLDPDQAGKLQSLFRVASTA